MRIAYICQSYPPMVSGAALMAQRLAEGMTRRGHTVLVIAASDRRRAYTDSAGGLRLARLHSLPNPARVGQCFLLWPKRGITAELETFCPDVVHLHDLLSAGLPGLRAAHVADIPVVQTVHQLPWFASA